MGGRGGVGFAIDTITCTDFGSGFVDLVFNDRIHRYMLKVTTHYMRLGIGCKFFVLYFYCQPC